MRAGSGIEHAEGGGNPPHINKHGFQLWINLPSTMKMDQPAYGTVQPEAVPELRSSGGGMSRFVAGKGSLALNDRDDFMIVDCELPANTSHVLEVPQHLVGTVIAYAYQGHGTIGAKSLRPRETAVLAPDPSQLGGVWAHPQAVGAIELRATSESGLGVMVFVGQGLGEPIAWRGPIVMNTQAEIATAYSELRSGRFLAKRARYDYRLAADESDVPYLKSDDAVDPPVAPFKPGATKLGQSWECAWLHDVSTVQVYNLGAAGSSPKSQDQKDGKGPHASAAACEAWCCETPHLSLGPPVNGGKKATRTTVESDPPCDFWQWADTKTNANFGCWVASTEFDTSKTVGAKPDWIGAQGCTRPGADWGVTVLAATFCAGLAYLVLGALYMKQARPGGGLLVHRLFWEEVAGMVSDGMAFVQGGRSGYSRVGGRGPRQLKQGEKKKKKKSSQSRFVGGREGGDY